MIRLMAAPARLIPTLLMYGGTPPSAGHCRRLAALAGGEQVTVADDEATARAAAAGAEVILGHRFLRQALEEVDAVGPLRWVHSTAGGPDHLPLAELARRFVMVTRTPIFARDVAWHALALGLSASRRLPGFARGGAGVARPEGVARDVLGTLGAPRAALVLGVGQIGQVLAGLLRGLGVRVTGAARRPNPAAAAACDELVVGGGWRDRLGEFDWVALCLPGRADTADLFDAAAVAALRPTTVIVNVGRAVTLDHAAVLTALEAGRLGGFAADVAEDVPADVLARLSARPDVILTPKQGTFTPRRRDRLEAHVERQFARYAAGRPLRDVAASPPARAWVRRPADGPPHVLLTMLCSRDPAVAAEADAAGVDRVGLDLEVLGKHDRQAGLGTWVSDHLEDHLPPLRRAVTRGELFCRVNPLHEGTAAEVDRVVAAGAEVLMLPMFTSTGQVRAFVELVANRARVVPLLETRAAARAVREVVRVRSVDELHVGLTDLSLQLRVGERFALLGSPLLARVARTAREAGVRLGVGGVGRARDRGQRVASDLIYAQYPRLGATAALVSRAFLGGGGSMAHEVAACRARLAWWHGRGPARWERARLDLLRATAPDRAARALRPSPAGAPGEAA